MALIKKQDKGDNGKKPPASRSETALNKKEAAKKPVPKVDKKPVQVKKETVNRLERAKKYFRGVYNELKKVHWPTRREILTYTAVVVVAVIIVSVLIWIFDSLMSQIMKLIIR